jgi:glucokinase
MLFVGLDLCGTNVKGVVTTERGEVLASRSAPTDRRSSQAAVASAAALGSCLVALVPGVAALGITVPGRFDEAGRAVQVPNIPGDWRGVPIVGPVSEVARRPAALINDARAFGLAEQRFGAARGSKHAVGVVLGTGIGGALIIDGRLVTGPTGGAGELGHTVVLPDGPPCGCGNRGCLETLAKSEVFARRAGMSSVPEVAAAAQAGDPRALNAVAETAQWISLGIANVVTLVNPDVVFLGGGVMQCGDLLLDPIRSALPALTPFVAAGSYRVAAGELGPTAGALGAAAWAIDSFSGSPSVTGGM